MGTEFYMGRKRNTFEKELEKLLKKYPRVKASDIPDRVLASYIKDCIDAYCKAETHSILFKILDSKK
jgi:hypothetical protein